MISDEPWDVAFASPDIGNVMEKKIHARIPLQEPLDSTPLAPLFFHNVSKVHKMVLRVI
jgi:hypothetical protein